MKLRLPEEMLKNVILIKEKDYSKLKVYFTNCKLDGTEEGYFFNPYTGTNFCVTNPPNVEYVIKYNDRVKAVCLNGTTIEGTYLGLSHTFGFKIAANCSYPPLIFDNIQPVAKESPVVIRARETLVEAKATVEAAQRVVNELEC